MIEYTLKVNDNESILEPLGELFDRISEEAGKRKIEFKIDSKDWSFKCKPR